jgi:ankyrin repeat protein
MHRCGQGEGRSVCHQWHVHPHLVITPDFSLNASSDSRSLLTASYRSLLRTYILSPPNDPPSQNLITLLSSPRARLIDLSYLDDASGTTLLHEATRRKNFRLVDLSVRAGADVFIRDRKGRSLQEVVGKDDKMRVFLQQCECHPVSHLNVFSPPCSREQRHHAFKR